MRKTRKPISRDILEIAAENARTYDPASLFGLLFDAAMRSVRHLPSDYPGRWMVLQQAWDTIHQELGGTESGLPGVAVPLAEEGRAGVLPRRPGRKYTP